MMLEKGFKDKNNRMLTASLFGPTEHVAVTDPHWEQQGELCVLDVFIHTLNVFR